MKTNEQCWTEYKKIMYDKKIKEMENAWELEKIKRRNRMKSKQELEDLGFERSDNSEWYIYKLSVPAEDESTISKTIFIYKQNFTIQIYYKNHHLIDNEKLITSFEKEELKAITNTIDKLKKEEEQE